MKIKIVYALYVLILFFCTSLEADNMGGQITESIRYTVLEPTSGMGIGTALNIFLGGRLAYNFYHFLREHRNAQTVGEKIKNVARFTFHFCKKHIPYFIIQSLFYIGNYADVKVSRVGYFGWSLIKNVFRYAAQCTTHLMRTFLSPRFFPFRILKVG